MTEAALYRPDGDGYSATEITAGGWSAQAQSGGAVLALLGHVLDDVATLTPMSLTRLTADLVRPAPIGVPLRVHHSIVREGKKIQVVELTATSDGIEVARARALRVRNADLRGIDGIPVSTTDDDPAARLPPRDSLPNMIDSDGPAEFLRSGVEFRRTHPTRHEVNGLWCRLLVPVVAGEPVRATSRATLPMDLVNLIGVGSFGRGVTAINADVSAHVLRPPVGEWIGLVGDTRFGHQVGHGVSAATMSDDDGVFGLTSTSQVVDVASPDR